METKNFSFIKDLETDYYNINTVNENLDKIDAALGCAARFEKAAGTANAITLTEVILKDGCSKTFIANQNNNRSSTTINGKPVYKPGTTSAPSLVAGKAYTVWFNESEDCFFIKASAEGTAVAEHVLAGETFSNDDDVGIPGEMLDHGPSAAETIQLNAQNQEYTIVKGYHSGLRKIKAVISGLVAGVIKAGITVGGILGTFTADATATAAHILQGKTAGVNGEMATGTMPHLTGVRNAQGVGKWGDGALAIYIERGYQDGGTGNGEIKVTPAQLQTAEPDLTAGHILAGKSIFGTSGNIPIAPSYPIENSATGFDAYNDPPNPSQGNHNVFMQVPRGYYDNTWVGVLEPNLKAENIKAGVTIGEGVKITGTYTGGKIKSIQSGYARISSTDSLNRTITISSVNPNYSLIIAQLSSANDSSDANKAEHNCVGVELLDATTIRLVKQYKSGSGLSDSAQCRWTVIEFEPEAIKSKQSGIASFPSDGSIHTVRSISIAPVTDTSKCLVLISMTSNNTNTPLARFIYACHAGWPNNSMFYVDLYQLASGDDRDIYWQVIEFN